MTDWRILICQGTTGLVVDELVPLGPPDWATEIGTKGSWGCQIRLGDVPNSKTNVLDYATSGRYFWSMNYGSLPIQAGFPTSANFDQKSVTLNVTGEGIGGVFDSRIVRTANATPATLTSSANNYALSGVTPRRVLRELVARSLADTDSGAGLPIDTTDAQSETGSTTRNFAGWDLATVWKRLADETDNNNGCEYLFRPYAFTSGVNPCIGFAFKIGTPTLGNPSLNAAWELNAAFGNVDVDYNMAIRRPHRVWSKGSGDGGAAVIGYAQNTAALQAAGVPYSDYVDTQHNDATVKATLDGYAAAILAEYAVPVETWTATVRIDGVNDSGRQISPELGSWAEGDQPLFRVTDHPVIPDGGYRRRIIGMSNGDPGTVKLKIQPTPLA